MIRRALQWAYDHTIRPHCPRKLGVYNGVVVRGPRLFDATDHKPEYEAALVRVIAATVRAGDGVVIVGGGFGVSTVWAARTAGPRGEVAVYEAASERVGSVREAARLNGVGDRVTARRALVGPAVQVWGDATTAPKVGPGDLPECDVLVLDCEGAERQILRGLTVTPRAIVVESHGLLGSPPDTVRSTLDAQGYGVDRERDDDPEQGRIVMSATAGGGA